MWRVKYLYIAIGLIVLLGIVAVFKFLRGKVRGESPYEAKGNLLTPAELKFLGVLDQVIGSHYRIMAQPHTSPTSTADRVVAHEIISGDRPSTSIPISLALP